MTNPADEHIAELIEILCTEVDRFRFKREFDNMQMAINQIAQLRASMNPVIHMKKNKD
jgi:hypothetical protein